MTRVLPFVKPTKRRPPRVQLAVTKGPGVSITIKKT